MEELEDEISLKEEFEWFDLITKIPYFLYLILRGKIDEAEKYAKLLGYNYGSSEWYQNTYSLFDKNYKIRKKSRLKEIKKKNKKVLKKFRTLFE